jgi:hypothetical protein
MVKVENLDDLYKHSPSMSPGHEFNYKGWKFKKCDGVEHSVYMLINPDGNQIENLTIRGYNSKKEFKEKVEEIIEYNPDDMHDWLNRNK